MAGGAVRVQWCLRVSNLNVISMFTVAERKSENSKLITWGGWLVGEPRGFLFHRH